MFSNEEIKNALEPGKTALLIWDVQKSLVRSIFNTGEFLANLNKVVSSAREKGVCVFFSKSTPLPEKFESRARKFLMKHRSIRLKQIPGGLDLAIEPLFDEMVITKNTASMFIGTNFEMILRNAQVQTIVFTGIATEYGIESSARDASNRGFIPVIVSDAVSSFDEEGHKRSLENLKNMMVVIRADELISLW